MRLGHSLQNPMQSACRWTNTHTHTVTQIHTYVWLALEEAAAHPQHVVRINDISHEHFARATDNSRSNNNNNKENGNGNSRNNRAHKESETVSCLSCPIVQAVQVVQLSSLQGMSVSAFRPLVFCPTSSIALSRCLPGSLVPVLDTNYARCGLDSTRLASLQLGAPSNHKSIKVVRFAVLRAQSRSHSPTQSPAPTQSPSLSPSPSPRPSPSPSLGLSVVRLTSL